ncbi:hypothetical protein [uncultured Hymenobacter sp.]|uniref:hypothetical protein n=1 Tax=uncultured Hymenobacter sp. TaxID=170016 RepID=UPI0035CA3407
MNLAAEKLNFIQQILLLDEAAFAELQHFVAARGLTHQGNPVAQSISDDELTAQFHEARRQGANEETYSSAEVAALAQQWQTK